MCTFRGPFIDSRCHRQTLVQKVDRTKMCKSLQHSVIQASAAAWAAAAAERELASKGLVRAVFCFPALLCAVQHHAAAKFWVTMTLLQASHCVM